MKSVAIEFVSSNAWRKIWIGALAFCLMVLSVGGWHYARKRAEIQAVRSKIQQLREEQQAIAQKVAPSHPRAANEQQIRTVLRRDWNKVFSTVENLNEPTVRLRSLTINGVTGSIRVEYEMDTVQRATSVTELLNLGYDSKPWRFEGVQSASSSTALPQGGGARASWVADYERL